MLSGEEGSQERKAPRREAPIREGSQERTALGRKLPEEGSSKEKLRPR